MIARMTPPLPGMQQTPAAAARPQEDDVSQQPQRHAWEREMERAQMAAWLGLGLLQAGGEAGAAARAPSPSSPAPAPAPALRISSAVEALARPAQPAQSMQTAPGARMDGATDAQGRTTDAASPSLHGAWSPQRMSAAYARAGAADVQGGMRPAPAGAGDAAQANVARPAHGAQGPMAAVAPPGNASVAPSAPVADGAPAAPRLASHPAAPDAQERADSVTTPRDAPASTAAEHAAQQAVTRTQQLAAQLSAFGDVAAMASVAAGSGGASIAVHLPQPQPQPQPPLAPGGAAAQPRMDAGVLRGGDALAAARAVAREASAPAAAVSLTPWAGAPGAGPAAAAAGSAAAASSASAGSVPDAVTDPEPPDALAPAATPRRAAPAVREADAPIRLHAQWSDEGVRLWLALDAQVLAQMAPIAQQLRQWLRAQGIALLSLMCNGRPLEAAARPSRPVAASTPPPAESTDVFEEKPAWRSVP